MHTSNMKIWLYCKNKYGRYFTGPNKIVEFGSHNVNGTIRNLFISYTKYIGVDWRAGPNVEFVSLAHEVPWHNEFDSVVSSSLLEHDPYWEKTLPKMVDTMKEDACLMLSWGGALNPPHCHDHACDGLFHPLPAKSVIDVLEGLGMYIHEFRYEGKLEGVNQQDCISEGGMGEVFLVAFKDRKYAIGDSVIDELMPEDALLSPIKEISTKKMPKDKKYISEHKEELAYLRKWFPKNNAN